MNCPLETGSSNLRPIPFPSALKTSTLAFSRFLHKEETRAVTLKVRRYDSEAGQTGTHRLSCSVLYLQMAELNESSCIYAQLKRKPNGKRAALTQTITCRERKQCAPHTKQRGYYCYAHLNALIPASTVASAFPALLHGGVVVALVVVARWGIRVSAYRHAVTLVLLKLLVHLAFCLFASGSGVKRRGR